MSISLDHLLLALVFAIFSCVIVFDDPSKRSKDDIIAINKIHSKSELESESCDTCIDHHELCQYWADLGQCQRNHTEMLRYCPVACDSCNDLDWNDNKEGCPNKYKNCESCKDVSNSKQCKQWKLMGECNKHPGYMTINCAQTCKYCHLQSEYNLRCPTNEQYMKQTRVLPNPGDLNNLFETIISNYNRWKKDDAIEWELDILSTDPWILRFDNFFSEQEAKGIVEAAAGKFERSTDVGKKDETGHFAKITSKSRTSKNAWCHEHCWNHPMVQKVMGRVETLLNISMDNSEHLQILQYEKNQFYKTHHDYIPNQVQMSCGPRILTWFMYLSDVEEGGGTDFPRLKITNLPKLGRAILWPSVLNEDPTKKDDRTYHQALPVIKGVKYGANAWMHLHDFQTPNLWSCTG